MIAVVTLAYIALIVLIYRLAGLKPAPRNIAVMVALGVILIGGILIVWKFSAPMAGNLVVSRYSVPIVPQVKGPVTKIHAQPNVPLRKGIDLLLEIQPDVYQNTVTQISERLAASQQTVSQLESGIVAAQAGVKKANATLLAAKAELEVDQAAVAKVASAVSELEIRQLQQAVIAAEAGVEQAKAELETTRISKEVAESTTRSLQAELANATFNLQQCKVYAPNNGFVTSWAIREGTMAAPLPMTKLGTFVDDSQVLLTASFPQNLLTNVAPGDRAELTFRTHPGQVFAASVETIVQATGEGQFQAGGELINASQIGTSGMLPVKFTLEDQQVARELPMGAGGTVAIYTQKGTPFHIISRVVTRMNAWKYYLLPF